MFAHDGATEKNRFVPVVRYPVQSIEGARAAPAADRVRTQGAMLIRTVSSAHARARHFTAADAMTLLPHPRQERPTLAHAIGRRRKHTERGVQHHAAAALQLSVRPVPAPRADRPTGTTGGRARPTRSFPGAARRTHRWNGRYRSRPTTFVFPLGGATRHCDGTKAHRIRRAQVTTKLCCTLQCRPRPRASSPVVQSGGRSAFVHSSFW